MKRVNITIGPVTFDHADYDAEHDVLYLHVGKPQPGEGEETPEGHVIRYVPGTSRIAGLTMLGPRRILERDGHLTVSIPETIENHRRRPRARPRCRLTAPPRCSRDENATHTARKCRLLRPRAEQRIATKIRMRCISIAVEVEAPPLHVCHDEAKGVVRLASA